MYFLFVSQSFILYGTVWHCGVSNKQLWCLNLSRVCFASDTCLQLSEVDLSSNNWSVKNSSVNAVQYIINDNHIYHQMVDIDK